MSSHQIDRFYEFEANAGGMKNRRFAQSIDSFLRTIFEPEDFNDEYVDLWERCGTHRYYYLFFILEDGICVEIEEAYLESHDFHSFKVIFIRPKDTKRRRENEEFTSSKKNRNNNQ